MKRSDIEDVIREHFPKLPAAQYKKAIADLEARINRSNERAVEKENYACVKMVESWCIVLKNDNGSEILVAPGLLKRISETMRKRVE